MKTLGIPQRLQIMGVSRLENEEPQVSATSSLWYWLVFVSLSGMSVLFKGSAWFILSAFLLIAVMIGIPALRTRRAAEQEIREFEKDFVAYLFSVAMSVGSGKDVLSATLQKENMGSFCAPLRKALLSLDKELQRGVCPGDALNHFANSVRHPEIPLLQMALQLSLKEGGALKPICIRIARVVRQRQAFRRKVKAALAMQKVSAYGLIACCGVMLTFQMSTNFQAVSNALTRPEGKLFLGAGLVLMVAGLSWLLALSRRQW